MLDVAWLTLWHFYMDVKPCKLADWYQGSQATCYINLYSRLMGMMMELVDPTETLITTCTVS
jgi:hypothetical protein